MQKIIVLFPSVQLQNINEYNYKMFISANTHLHKQLINYYYDLEQTRRIVTGFFRHLKCAPKINLDNIKSN